MAKIPELRLGEVGSEVGKQIALQEIQSKINELIRQFNETQEED